MNIRDPEFRPLRAIFRCMSKLESILGLMPQEAARTLVELAEDFASEEKARFQEAWAALSPLLRGRFMGSEFDAIISTQRKTLNVPLPSTIDFLLHIGELNPALAPDNKPCRA